MFISLTNNPPTQNMAEFSLFPQKGNQMNVCCTVTVKVVIFYCLVFYPATVIPLHVMGYSPTLATQFTSLQFNSVDLWETMDTDNVSVSRGIS